MTARRSKLRKCPGRSRGWRKVPPRKNRSSSQNLADPLTRWAERVTFSFKTRAQGVSARGFFYFRPDFTKGKLFSFGSFREVSVEKITALLT